MGGSWKIYVVRGGLSGDIYSCCYTQLFLTEQLTEILKSLILYCVLLPVKSSHTILGLVDDGEIVPYYIGSG